ncbi:N-acetyl-gamma-glutamyl-phosphate reductase [Alphaproteobacteria bacterium LSUCC0684]
MTYQVFIDGEAGTTGLQVHARLQARDEIRLIRLDDARRKDRSARREAMAAADAVILCLPDDAAIEAVDLAEGLDCTIIDASTAHRVAEGWVYGFPELAPGQRERISSARRIANVGCYATAMIALLRPLIDAGVLDPDQVLSIPAVSGYTGGGKALIEYMEKDAGPKHFGYALDLAHKHIPEVMHHAGLLRKPLFMPMVGNFPCGMLVELPLAADQLKGGTSAADLHAIYAAHYEGETFIDVHAPFSSLGLTDKGYLAADALRGTNRLEIFIFGHEGTSGEPGQYLCAARLDNLGKGASGAAVQNLNLCLGLDETAGLMTAPEA